MIRVLEWNVGYETADTRKLRHNLPWVRVTVPLADLRWAKLWSLEDAAKIWSGWMALVFCASQSSERGTVESVESVSLLSRVPVGMVQAGLDWAVANGMAELSGDHQKDSGNIPDDSENNSGLRTYVRDGTLRNETNKAARVREPEQAGRIPANEWTPDSSHAGICAVRNLSMELQLERFRATANATTGAKDTPEGWSRRFMAWIAKGRPEPVFSPATPFEPPTVEQWMTYAKEFAPQHPPFREDPGYFWPADLARAAWGKHQANQWARVADWKAQLEADCQTWSGYELANRMRPAR